MSVPEVKSLWRSKQGSEHMLINVDSLSLPQLLHTPLLADAHLISIWLHSGCINQDNVWQGYHLMLD